MKLLLQMTIINSLLSLLLINNYALMSNSNQDSELTVIKTYHEDVTGNGLDEKIELKGALLSKDADYYREIIVDITNADDKQWTIFYQGGYNPSISFIDLYHTNKKVLIYESAIQHDGDEHLYYIHSFEKKAVKKQDLPKHHYINGAYKDNFKVEIMVAPRSKPIFVDIEKYSDEYIQQGIYDSEGKVIKATSINVKSHHFIEPIDLGETKGYGLKSYQHIKDKSDNLLGTIETIWYYEHEKWIIVQTEWVLAS